MEKWQHIALVIAILAAIGAAFRVWTTETFKAFRWYLCIYIVRSVVSLPADLNSPRYYLFWRVSEPILFIALTFAVYEAYRKLCASYPGLGWLGTWILNVALAIAVLFAISTLRLDASGGVSEAAFKQFLILERWASTVLAMFLLLVWLFFSRYPLNAGSNLRHHFTLLTGLLGAEAATLLAVNLGNGHVTAWVNLAISAAESCFYIGWALLMKRSGLDAVPVLRAGAVQHFEILSERARSLAGQAFGARHH